MSKPYFELKDVILARSGIQVYTYQELIDYGMPEPAVKKDYYLEYRPAGVLIKALGLGMFKMLPLTKEHPPEDINSANFPYYANGYTGSEVTVVPMEDGEIGLKSSLVFSTSDIYDYYKKGNKEVSVGYRAKKKWVEGEKYDVLLEEITSVNHLAVTAAGRGGSSVSVIDSLIGGIKMARTGYVAYLSRLGVQQDSVAPFSTTVFNALESLKGDNVEKALKPVFDSMGAIKEGAGKEQLKDIIRDMFDNKDLVMDKREESIKILDSIYEKSISDSISEMKSVVDACSDKKEEEPKKTEDSETKKEEEEPKKEEEEPKKEEPKKEEKKTEDTDGKGKNTNNIMDSLEPMIKEVVEKSINSFLNIKETKVQDSSVKSQEATFDDISFMF